MKTTKSLLTAAAERVLASVYEFKRLGHTDWKQAIVIECSQKKYRKAVQERAIAIMEDLFRPPTEKGHFTFGKAHTDSRNPYAKRSIVRNAEKTTEALLFAAEASRTPRRQKVNVVITKQITSAPLTHIFDYSGCRGTP